MIFLVLHHWRVLVVLAAIAVPMAILQRRRIARMIRLGKALATDPRLPRHVRWIFRASLMIKCLPLDFGVDETLMAVGAVLVAVRHREVWRAIREETR